MNEPERIEWQIRYAFNGFCKRTLKNESINAHKEIRKRQADEINFSDLTSKEKNQLYTCEEFFAEDKEEQTFFAGGKDMGDVEITVLYQIPRSTVQYRRNSSFELRKRYLEMTTQAGKTTDDERSLLPYPVIIAATKGEPQTRQKFLETVL